MSINGLESLPSNGNEVHILTHLHVREDILDLYGFTDSKERNTFSLLISISGIGPKLALTILSGIDPSELKDRIINGDVAALTSVPGVGPKTAKRIIIELKEKFIKSDDSSLGFDEEIGQKSELFKDVINALVLLGYKQNHAKKACRDRLPEFARGLPRLPGESIPVLEDSEDPWQGGLPRVFRWQRGGLPRKTPGKPSLLLTSVY